MEKMQSDGERELAETIIAPCWAAIDAGMAPEDVVRVLAVCIAGILASYPEALEPARAIVEQLRNGNRGGGEA
jgi:hypothetical protein